MTVDEAIERVKSKSILMNSKQAKEDWLTLAEYLEELKDLRKLKEQEEKACDRFYQKGRAEAIDEIKKYVYCNIHFYDAIEQEGFYKFLEQLKEK